MSEHKISCVQNSLNLIEYSFIHVLRFIDKMLLTNFLAIIGFSFSFVSHIIMSTCTFVMFLFLLYIVLVESDVGIFHSY